jgi:cell division protein FtsX
MTETRDQAYAEFLEIFKDQPELIDLARPAALPSSVQVKPADGVSTGQLAKHLRAEFPAAEVQSIGCRNPAPTT